MFRRQITNIWNSLDWFTVALYGILVIMGWFNIYAAVYNEEFGSIFDISQKYGRQLLWILAAIVLIVVILLIDNKIYVYFSYPIYAAVMLLLISVLLFGVEISGSRSWFAIGEFRIQPAEFSKFATILAIANFLSEPGRRLMKLPNFLIVLTIIAVPTILILLQNDTGSALVFTSLVFMLYREGLPGWILLIAFFAIVLFIIALTKPFYWVVSLVLIACWIYAYLKYSIKRDLVYLGIFMLMVIGAAIAITFIFDINIEIHWIMIGFHLLLALYLVYYSYIKNSTYLLSVWVVSIMLIGFSYSVDYIYDNVLQPHQRDRIDHVLGINFDPLGAGYNVNQSKIAIGSGGFWGKGFLQGTQTKYDFVPEQSTDFIFCTIGEEWGFVGSSIVIILFVTLLLRIIYLAERQRSKFRRIYGYGVFSVLFFHVAVNIGMTIGIAPVIGIPLPFFSYGGSSLWAFTILLFIFLKLDASRAEQMA